VRHFLSAMQTTTGFTVEGGPDELDALVELAARVLVSVIKRACPRRACQHGNSTLALVFFYACKL